MKRTLKILALIIGSIIFILIVISKFGNTLQIAALSAEEKLLGAPEPSTLPADYVPETKAVIYPEDESVYPCDK